MTPVRTEQRANRLPARLDHFLKRIKLASLTLGSRNQSGMHTSHSFTRSLASKARPAPSCHLLQASLSIQCKTTSLHSLGGEVSYFYGKKKVHICKIKFSRLIIYLYECACRLCMSVGSRGSFEWVCKEWIMSWMNVLLTRANASD